VIRFLKIQGGFLTKLTRNTRPQSFFLLHYQGSINCPAQSDFSNIATPVCGVLDYGRMAERETNTIEPFILSLPDPQAARVFLQRLEIEQAVYAARCRRNPLLFSRLLLIATYSPFLAENLLCHPDDIDWFERESGRGIGQGKTTEQLFEDLSRFATRMYDADARTLLARFKNRELLRIYLRDCLTLATLAEVTEELSNLADVILSYALKFAMQEVTNEHGSPLIRDERGRISQAEFAIIALGKLGCHELNYASDIDLMFLYSGLGETAGDGRSTDSVINNKEFFARVAQRVIKTLSGLSVEGGVYRVDLRLRPYGRDGDLVWEIQRAAEYYYKTAENWERQMLIRARASAGSQAVFAGFFDLVRDVVFNQEPHPEALADVRRVKDQIDRKVAKQSGGFNVKLGLGGIREIEFIAQALQLAYGGREPWLRSAQTLIVLARLAEKGFLAESERTALSSAYTFFRVVEHRLQMEYGAQTHTLPVTQERLELLARRCGYQTGGDITASKSDPPSANRAAIAFQRDVESHAAAVRAIYNRVLKASVRTETEASTQTFVRTQDSFSASREAADTSSQTATTNRQTIDAESLRQSLRLPEAQDAQAIAPSGFDDETTRLLHHAATALRNLLASQRGAPSPGVSQNQMSDLSSIETLMGSALDAAINPIRSLKNLTAWAESFATYNNEASQKLLREIVDHLPTFVARLLAIFSSQYLSGILISRPLLSRVFFETRRLSNAQEFFQMMRASIDEVPGFADQADALRHVWYELILGIGNRDLSTVGSRQPAVGKPGDDLHQPFVEDERRRAMSATNDQALSADDRLLEQASDRLRASNLEQTALAEASLQLAAEITLASMGIRHSLPFAIMGLGRLGHAGMDYGSDLDLLIVFDDAANWPIASALAETKNPYGTAQEFYANFTAQLLKLLSSITREGFIYRVDLRLRPEGKNGQLAQGLTSLLAYLNERASAWEHSAYLKVREVAGDLTLGARVRQMICQTVFAAASTNPSLKEDLAAMRARLEKEKAKGNRRDIKWGAGAMSDVYFITRYLQLRDRVSFPTENGTAALIRKLGECGSMDQDVAKDLFAGYTFLRRLDHWMRLLLDRPTPVLPASQVALHDIARSLGLASIEDFERHYAQHTSIIRSAYARVFSE
jgi:glutamate-ammonia-ligase adenylyltransferase